jgi:hypothetical protein
MENHPIQQLEAAIKTFAILPPEAIIKQDVLRLGLRFSDDSLRIASGYKPKDYFIFSFDLASYADLESAHQIKAPEEIRISGGLYNLASTVISVRLNPSSPYEVRLVEGKLALYCGKSLLSDVEYHPSPAFYNHFLSDGSHPAKYAPVLQWGYLVYLTVYHQCQYFTDEDECRFCDMNRHVSERLQTGRAPAIVKPVHKILEAMDLIFKHDEISQAVTVTGGSILRAVDGMNECDFYSQYGRALRERFGDRWILKAVIEALPSKQSKMLKESGFDIYHPNYEVFEPELFEKLCPGKTKRIGYQNWMNWIVEAAEHFGPESVIPNFVAGVEMNSVCGYSTPSEALQWTLKGLDFFMSKGILPRFTTWCPEPLSRLGIQAAPPLEYYCILLREYRQKFIEYGLSHPEGYGPAGVGNAVFSVSAFMDVL